MKSIAVALHLLLIAAIMGSLAARPVEAGEYGIMVPLMLVACSVISIASVVHPFGRTLRELIMVLSGIVVLLFSTMICWLIYLYARTGTQDIGWGVLIFAAFAAPYVFSLLVLRQQKIASGDRQATDRA